MQSTEHGDRGDRGTGKFGRDVLGDSGKAQDIDVHHLAGSSRRLKVLAAVIPQPEVKTLSGRGLFDHVGVPFELIADCGSNEICSVRVEPFLHHQVDLTKIDKTKIDRDFLGVSGPWSNFVDIVGHG
jgi:hypothetical protein